MAIYSLEVEKHVLAGLVKFPDVYPDIAPYVNERDFFDDVHSTIFLVIRSCAEKNERWDKVLLAEKIKNIGISFKNEIDIYEYIDNLSFVPITIPATISATRELKKLRVRREIDSTAQSMQDFVKKNGNLPIDDIVGGVDGIYGEKISIYEPDDKPLNIFEGLNEMVEERGNSPLEETGLKGPYPEFNRLYGGFKPQNVYAFASRPGQGKTTLLNDLALKLCILNDTKSFVGDTEMPTKDIQWRTAAARSGVPLWHVETGNWRRNEEMVRKFRESKAKNEEYAKKKYITHFHIGNKTLDQFISMVRRWHKANIKPGQIGVIVYDYLKITIGEGISDNYKEYQALGHKIDRLKRLAEELNIVILTAIQLNRTGENQNRKPNEVVLNSTALAISDRLQWIASFVAIFCRKTIDEITLDGPENGTHMMIPLKTRFQGRDATGHHDLVRRVFEDGEVKYVNNYLNFIVENFDVREVGSLVSMLATQNSHEVPVNPNPNDGQPL